MIELGMHWGNEIKSSIANAMKIAKEKGDLVRFEWDFCNVVVASDSNPDLIYRDYHRAIYGCLGDKPTLGPHPVAELSQSVIDSDQAFRDAAKKRSEERQAEWAAKEKERYQKLNESLAKCPSLKIVDNDLYESLKRHSSNLEIMEFATNWGRLMQAQIDFGKTVAQCAMETSILADNGNSGASFGLAVGVLARCWSHGGELLAWHEAR